MEDFSSSSIVSTIHIYTVAKKPESSNSDKLYSLPKYLEGEIKSICSSERRCFLGGVKGNGWGILISINIENKSKLNNI